MVHFSLRVQGVVKAGRVGTRGAVGLANAGFSSAFGRSFFQETRGMSWLYCKRPRHLRCGISAAPGGILRPERVLVWKA